MNDEYKHLHPAIEVTVDWSRVGHVHGVGWGSNREDGGPDGIVVSVHFPEEGERQRVVILDPDDINAILDNIQRYAPGGSGVN